MTRGPLIAVVALVALFLAYSSVIVVNEREQALILRFGEIRRTITAPGIYFKTPTNLVETVQYIDDRLLPLDIDDISVQVQDGRRYLVDAFVAFRVADARKFREVLSGDFSNAEINLRTRLDAALRRVYGQRSFEAALSTERAQMMREVRDQLRPVAADLGIEIADVRIKRTELLPEVSEQTFERMKAERLAEAAELRARGTQEKLRIEAEADREATVTIANARRESEIVRGQGDAERNRIFADAYKRDPEFFAFYRSMAAYENAMPGPGTTMVLSPDSEFFRFFREAGQPSAVMAAPTAAGATTEPTVGETSGTSDATPGTPAVAAPASTPEAPSGGATAPAPPAPAVMTPSSTTPPATTPPATTPAPAAAPPTPPTAAPAAQ